MNLVYDRILLLNIIGKVFIMAELINSLAFYSKVSIQSMNFLRFIVIFANFFSISSCYYCFTDAFPRMFGGEYGNSKLSLHGLLIQTQATYRLVVIAIVKIWFSNSNNQILIKM